MDISSSDEIENYSSQIGDLMAGRDIALRDNERLQRENGSLARMYAACEQTLRERTEIVGLLQAEVAGLSAENERLRGLIRTAHDNADYIVSMLKSSSDAVTVWPQTWHAVMLLKAEAIMALEDEISAFRGDKPPNVE